MNLGSGTRLGPYEIVSLLGAGGMGEVYLARDSRLDRRVAIKILPAELASHPEKRQRFEREARAVGSLNHPHICVLHDIREDQGVHFLVMEYLEGETLAQRLSRVALPLDLVLRYAVEMAEALEQAHRHGVVHRDLKPANVMVTKSGVKLLDFGLAKFRAETSGASGLSSMPTESRGLTADGVIPGTLQYMAPEQLEAKEADARTDLFAFGAIVYEMATGRRAFSGESAASLVAAILEHEPASLCSIQRAAPPLLEHVVKRCLAKDPDERWQTAADLARELKWVAESRDKEQPSPAPKPGAAGALAGLRLPILAAGLVGILIGAVAILIAVKSPAQKLRSVTRFSIELPATDPMPLAVQKVMALSSDGSRLVYAAGRGPTRLYLRDLNRFEAIVIPGSEGGNGPFFSPDGQWLGFTASNGTLKKVPLSGGAPLVMRDVLAQFGGGYGATFASNDTILLSPSTSSGLWRVAASGGTAEVVTTPDRAAGETSYRWPEALPDGKTVLFTIKTSDMESFDEGSVAALSLQSGTRRVLVHGGTHAVYSATGHIVYARGGALLAAPFDRDRLEVTGPPQSILEGVAVEPTSGVAHFTLSTNGTLAYAPAGPDAFDTTLVEVDRNGATRPLAEHRRIFRSPRFSPDGMRLAVQVGAPFENVWIWDEVRDTFARLTLGGNNFLPVWTPDGRRVTFASDRYGPANLFWQAVEGGGEAERLTESEGLQWPQSWSPDGRVLAFVELNPSNAGDLWCFLAGERRAEPYLTTSFDEILARFSPDGRWIAYVSNESGRYEVWLQTYPRGGGKWQISTDGGNEPVWGPQGREIFYRNGDQMMVVAIAAGSGLSVSKPRLLYKGNYERAPTHVLGSYDVSPDGKHFVMIRSDQPAVTQINVVLNWFEELESRFAGRPR